MKNYEQIDDIDHIFEGLTKNGTLLKLQDSRPWSLILCE